MTTTFDYEITHLWEAISGKVRKEWLVANALEKLLRTNGVNENSWILDSAGGFGFPVIDLANRGFNGIIYNDGSPDMYSQAVQRAAKQNAPFYPFTLGTLGGPGHMTWQEFGALPSDEYDCVLCTGNSLPYAALSWGAENPDLDQSLVEIEQTLSHFYRILKAGGILYVDKQPEDQTDSVEEVGIVDVLGSKLEVTCTAHNDKVNRVRNWVVDTKDVATGEINQYHSQGYLLLESDLLDMLKNAGFSSVKPHNLNGDVYEGFVAYK